MPWVLWAAALRWKAVVGAVGMAVAWPQRSGTGRLALWLAAILLYI